MCSGISHYVLIAYNYHELGCIECVRQRLKDKNVPIDTFSSSIDMDWSIINKLKKEVVKGEGLYYYVYDLMTKEITKLRMIKYPQCRVCAETESIDSLLDNTIIPVDDALINGYRSKRFSEVARYFKENIESYLHPRFGLFNEHVRTISDSMPLISMFATLGERTFDSHGRAETYRGSFFTAILEGLERFHGATPSTISRYYASEKDLFRKNKVFVSLNDFNHIPDEYYMEDALQVEGYSTDIKTFWRYAYYLNQKKYVLLPEELVYFSSDDFYVSPYNKRFILDSSNGIALGSNFIEASIGGLFEVIERDAFLVHWYSKSSPLKVINIQDLKNRNINMIIALLQLNGYTTHIFDITLESKVPTFWILLELKAKPKDNIAFYTTAGTDIDPEKAIESALVEASTSIRAFEEYQKIHGEGPDSAELMEDYKKIRGLDDHIRLYSSGSMGFAFDFAINTERTIDANDLIKQRSGLLHKYTGQKDLFKSLVNNLFKYHEIYQANLTSRTLQAMGFNCVKIIIPTMQNIGFGYLHQNINKKRIKQAVHLNNLNGEIEVINNEPHPFP